MAKPLKVPRELTPEMYALYEQDGLSLREVGELYGVTETTVRRRFLEEGLPTRPQASSRRPATLRERVEHGEATAAAAVSYGPEYMAECIAMAAAELGHPPANGEYRLFAREWALPSTARVIQVYETWNAALRAAGLEPNQSPRGYRRHFSYEACLEAIRDCGREIGRPPTLREYEEWARRHRNGGKGTVGRYPSASLIRQRGPGSWVGALADAFPEEMK